MSATASQAGGGGGTKIRIKFGASSAAVAPASPRRASRSSAVAVDPAVEDGEDDELLSDDEGDASRYTIRGELRKGPKRDRRAERARAEERKRLGLPPRASITKALTGKSGIQRRSGGRRRASRSYADGDEDEDEDEDEEMDDEEAEEGGEEYEGGEGGRNEWDGYDSETGRPLRASTSRAPAQLVRRRLPDSFFHSTSLRDAVMASHGPNARRASTRVAYAFGERLPDAALLNVAEFEPRGGVAGDEDDDEEGYSRTTLEAMVQERSLERHGETMVLLDGRILPKSALDVWRDGPLAVSPARRSALSSVAPSAAASVVQDSASDAGSTVTGSSRLAPPAAPLARRSGALWASDASPSVSNAPSPAPASPPASLAPPPPSFEEPPPPRPPHLASTSTSPRRSQVSVGPPMSLSMPMQQD